jgi:murein DD-endopeptidase MepM/ murein hydrolase activator NlpD
MPRRDSRRLIFLPLCLISIACLSPPYIDSSAPLSAPEEKDAEAPSVIPEIKKSFDIWRDNPSDFYSLLSGEAGPGDPLTLIFLPSKDNASYAGLKAALLSPGGKRLSGAPFFDWALDDEGHTLKACVFAAPSTYDGGEALVRIEGVDDGESGVIAEFALTLKDRSFVSEKIPLNPVNTALRTVPDPKKTAESERLWALISQTGSIVYDAGPFAPPLDPDTRRTSFFGDRRVYLYSNGKSDTAVHAGIDYGVPAGTPVKACGAGRVALAQERIVTGNSVIIEHLPGVYSIYYHLDKITAEEGTLVNEGDVIGLSGATGLATGPHLHWEIRVAAENTDPDTLCARAILDSGAAKKLVTERGELIYAELSQ